MIYSIKYILKKVNQTDIPKQNYPSINNFMLFATVTENRWQTYRWNVKFTIPKDGRTFQHGFHPEYECWFLTPCVDVLTSIVEK